MEQIPLRLLCRLDAPSVVPPAAIKALATYRDAVRFCWAQRLRKKLTKRLLAEEAGLHPSHVTCYLADTSLKRKHQRDLPADKVASFELACNNTAISQWLALQSKLTVYEEIQAERNAA